MEDEAQVPSMHFKVPSDPRLVSSLIEVYYEILNYRITLNMVTTRLLLCPVAVPPPTILKDCYSTSSSVRLSSVLISSHGGSAVSTGRASSD